MMWQPEPSPAGVVQAWSRCTAVLPNRPPPRLWSLPRPVDTAEMAVSMSPVRFGRVLNHSLAWLQEGCVAVAVLQEAVCSAGLKAEPCLDLYDANRWFNTPLNALALVHSCVWSRLSSAVAPCSFTPAEGHRQMGCKCVALAEDPPASGVRRALLQRLLNTPAREPTGPTHDGSTTCT
ncbi:unnamed protein product [Gadus morhua 'NCC']